MNRTIKTEVEVDITHELEQEAADSRRRTLKWISGFSTRGYAVNSRKNEDGSVTINVEPITGMAGSLEFTFSKDLCEGIMRTLSPLKKHL